MLGLAEYYKVQFLTLGVRFAVWYGLGYYSPVDLAPSAIKSVHAFALVFTTLVSCLFPLGTEQV